MNRISSFDVFDTCLTRRRSHPTDIFYDVAARILRDFDTDAAPSAIEDLVALRVQAERVLRARSNHGDTTLFDIWTTLATENRWLVTALCMEHELAIEAEMLAPVSESRRLVDLARSRGDRIIFISDMYLPTHFVRDQLLVHGFAHETDPVYVSGDLEKTKASGDLYRHVLATESISPRQIEHIGDNRHSDFLRPLSMGIRARHVDLTVHTRAESAILHCGIDRITASRIAGAMRAYRLECCQQTTNPAAHIASQFLGPFVLGVAAWALRCAQTQQQDRLYFLSRDCQLTWKVASFLSARFGSIDCRYLFMSRQAIYLPSSDAVCPSGMPWLRRSFERLSLDGQLAKFELSFDEVSPFLDESKSNLERNDLIASDDDWRRFWTLIDTPPVKDLVEQRIRVRRNAALDYFRRSGLMETPRTTIVDLGWYLTGQAALRSLLKADGYVGDVDGIYLALRQGRVRRSRAGNALALFYEPPSGSESEETLGSELFSRQNILEHIVGVADHRSVRGYEPSGSGAGAPFLFGDMSADESNRCSDLHREVLGFAERTPDLMDVLSNDHQATRVVLGTLLRCFFRFPDPESVSAVSAIHISADQNGRDASPLAAGRSVFQYLLSEIGLRTPLRSWIQTRHSNWVEGDIAISSATTRALARQKEIIRDSLRKTGFGLRRP
jgi:FMN phosphatase YigB (HAD superfamily)